MMEIKRISPSDDSLYANKLNYKTTIEHKQQPSIKVFHNPLLSEKCHNNVVCVH